VIKRFDTGRRGAVCAMVALACLVGAAVAGAQTPPGPDAGPPDRQGSDQCQAKATERNLTGNRRNTFLDRCEQQQMQRLRSRPTMVRPGRVNTAKAPHH
jgi:hypothetical protein